MTSSTRKDVEKGFRELSVCDAYASIFENGTGWWTVLCTNALSLNVAVVGMEITVAAFVSTCAGESFGASPAEQALFISASALSMAGGAFLLSPIADVIGRWKLLFWSTVTYVTFGVLTAAAWSFWSLLVFRAVLGFSGGGMFSGMDF
jgi:predicted MFS family arabinose efflux permease